MMQLWVTDRWEAYKGAATGISKCVSKRKVNGDESLTFQCKEQWEKGDRVVWKDLKGRWHENIIDGVDEVRSDDGLVFEYYAPSSAKIELSGDYLEDKRPYSTSAVNALTSALSESRWEVGAVDDLGTGSTNFYQIDAWTAIHDVADVWGGELEYEIAVTGAKITSRKVNLRSRVGKDEGRWFTYTKDLVSVQRSVDEGNVVTALYGYGAALPATDEEGQETGGYTRKLTFGDINGGKNWVGDDEALELWGRPDGTGKKHVFGKVDFPSCQDAQELKGLTEAELAKRCVPNISYKADVVTLERAGEGFDGADAGDTVTVVDKVFDPPLKVQARITEVQEDQLVSSETKYTFGNWQDLASKLSSQQSAISSLQQGVAGWNSAANQTAAYIGAIIDNVNQAVNALGGWTYIEPGNGIVTYDKPRDENPTKAIQLLGGAVRISNEKNSDGTWEWSTFGTGDGFFADLIVAGVLNASLIKAGILESVNGKCWINMETGEVRLSTDATVGGKPIATADAVAALDESLNQEEVFNRLTNNGAWQGIYTDENGDYFLNASFIASGVFTVLDDNGEIVAQLGNGIPTGLQVIDPYGSGEMLPLSWHAFAKQQAGNLDGEYKSWAFDQSDGTQFDKVTATRNFSFVTGQSGRVKIEYVTHFLMGVVLHLNEEIEGHAILTGRLDISASVKGAEIQALSFGVRGASVQAVAESTPSPYFNMAFGTDAMNNNLTAQQVYDLEPFTEYQASLSMALSCSLTITSGELSSEEETSLFTDIDEVVWSITQLD